MPVPYTANVTDNLDRGHLTRRAGTEPSLSFKLCNIMEKAPSTVVSLSYADVKLGHRHKDHKDKAVLRGRSHITSAAITRQGKSEC